MIGEWKAHLDESGREFMRGNVRLFLVQDLGERYAVNMGDNTMRTVLANEAGPEDAGWELPRQAWNAIVELVQATSRGEVARLEEALAVERRRVDSVLAAVSLPVEEQQP